MKTKMRSNLGIAAVCASILLAPLQAAYAAPDHVTPIKTYLDNQLKSKIAVDNVVQAIMAQNRRNAGLKQADIDGLDKQWRAEVDQGSGQLTVQVLETDVSRYLASVRDEAKGLITELFVTDNRGLNVAQSDLTSDYWQGDEAKWQKSFGAGSGAVFVDEIEMDESTQQIQAQASFTISDPATGTAIGAVTVGINVEMLDEIN